MKDNFMNFIFIQSKKYINKTNLLFFTKYYVGFNH